MKECRLTLLTEGRGDTVLVPPITWLLHEKLPGIPIKVEWADLAHVPRVQNGLSGKIKVALDYYPCDVLLVHRDADRHPRGKRVAEIQDATRAAAVEMAYVCVITVRMQEAWMLIDERAIRNAAGNPTGTVALRLPKLHEIESLADPKAHLHDLLRKASELTGRRLKKFSPSASAHRVGELIENWKPLRKLSAFVEFEKELDQVLGKLAVPDDH